MPPTSSAIGFTGEGEATVNLISCIAVLLPVCLFGFERSHSRHGPSYESGDV